MSKWFFLVTRPNGMKEEVGPYPDESVATLCAGLATEAEPESTVEAPVERADDYLPPMPRAQIHKSDGSIDVVYTDGTVVNLPAS